MPQTLALAWLGILRLKPTTIASCFYADLCLKSPVGCDRPFSACPGGKTVFVVTEPTVQERPRGSKVRNPGLRLELASALHRRVVAPDLDHKQERLLLPGDPQQLNLQDCGCVIPQQRSCRERSTIAEEEEIDS